MTRVMEHFAEKGIEYCDDKGQEHCDEKLWSIVVKMVTETVDDEGMDIVMTKFMKHCDDWSHGAL